MSLFHVREHVFDGEHIREYPRATAHTQEDILQLCAKQYIPKSNPNPQPGDVTLVAAHANGFVKELYEPLWDDLLKAAEQRGVRIRSIWIADAAWQGQSGILNEGKLGNDPSWYDHSRDLLQMINTFRRDMPRPLVGVGHSFGATNITYLSLFHPRLFSALVLLDPVLNFTVSGPAFGYGPLELSAVRRDLWPSREDAAKAFARSKFYASWDPRVLALWVQHGLRPVPTRLYPDQRDPADRDGKTPVTLTTTKHQEVFTYLRPVHQGIDLATGRRKLNVDRIPDLLDPSQVPGGLLDPASGKLHGGTLYRSESPNTSSQLPHVRPAVLYIFGGQSPMSSPPLRREKLELTGVGVNGSGGVAKGRVHEVVLEQCGHLVAMEDPQSCAQATAAWIEQELQRWRDEERELAVSWWGRKAVDKETMDEEFWGFIGKVPQRGAKKSKL